LTLGLLLVWDRTNNMKIILSRITGLIALIQFILGIVILYNNTQHCYYVWGYILVNVIMAGLHTIYVVIHDCQTDSRPIETTLLNAQGVNLNRFYIIVGLMGLSGLVLYLYLPTDCKVQYTSTYTDMWLYFMIVMWLHLGCLVLMIFIFVCQQIQLCCLSCRMGQRNANVGLQAPFLDNTV
jgi:hypothetical protein